MATCRLYWLGVSFKIRVVEKLILRPFLFYENGRSKQFRSSELWNFSKTLL
ncbi:hypothetical protein LEP1GSC191_0204 [Leptospira borgpetersenii serovar Mini str. 201000851]|nr:hypothetical protein LEP1GSC191_0204 [Leptospira borgpetersenii serovar Mini str. 201000851]